MLGVILAPYGKIPGSFPYGVAYSRGRGDDLCPFDAQWNTRGEMGYYYDSPLGALARKPSLLERWRQNRAIKQAKALGMIPSDFDLSEEYGYTPQYRGWVATTTGYIPGSWQPYTLNTAADWQPTQPEIPYGPSGFQRTDVGPWLNMRQLHGLGQIAPEPMPTVPGTPASVEDVVAQMNAHNDRVFALALVSTTAVAISALLTVFRTLKLIKEGARE